MNPTFAEERKLNLLDVERFGPDGNLATADRAVQF
jgi:hypothetical protein